MTTADPRLGLPSASKFDRLVACPGSHQLEMSLPEDAIPAEDADAARGTRIHRARETLNPLSLNAEETAVYERALEFEEQIVRRWVEDFDLAMIREGTREERLWLVDWATFDKLASGQIDVQYHARPHALVIDLKGGWASHVPKAAASYQLKFQAVTVWLEYEGIEHVRVAFNRAMRQDGSLDWCDYTRQDLENADREIRHYLSLARQPNAPRVPSHHCLRCPGKAWCPEAGSYSLLPSVIANPLQMVKQLSPEDCAAIFERKTVIEKILKEVQARLKSLSEPELRRLGLQLGNGKTLDPIVDTAGAYQHLLRLGFSESDLLRCLSFSKTELAALVARDYALHKEGAAEWLSRELDAFIERKSSEAALKLAKQS